MLIGRIPNVVGKDTILYLRKASIDPCQTCINGVLYDDLVPRFPINDGCRSDGNGNGWTDSLSPSFSEHFDLMPKYYFMV